MKNLILLSTFVIGLSIFVGEADALTCKIILSSTVSSEVVSTEPAVLNLVSSAESPVSSACVGRNCPLARVIQDITANGGEVRDLSAQAMSNVRSASERAKELASIGLDPELAQHIAFSEIGLDANNIYDDCKL